MNIELLVDLPFTNIRKRDNPVSHDIRREMFSDASFAAASFHTLDGVTCWVLTFDLAARTDGFQPTSDIHGVKSYDSYRPTAGPRLAPNPTFNFE